MLSVNLSGKVIDDPDLLGFITSALARHDVKAERLIFEITETQAVENTGAAVDLIRRVTELGCRFALDDFGSGFASYQYLKELPVDLVKIDGTFIRNMAMDDADRVFVRALAEVAQGLGKQTVAEFVEDETTLEMLRVLGVDYAQGYHVGRPRKHIAPHL
ncbi:MAG: EAL domain-containing protein [Gammaproteobacteria bacterium]|nr:MAG: EAL domain-containing protein [Gammaproteobacteria bacterium]